MYNEYRNANRETWKYTYAGKELLPFAKAKYQEFLDAEIAARKTLSSFMKDLRTSSSDPKYKQAEKDIEFNGSLREQCAVFAHEFERSPDKEHYLSLGDVVFFGIIQQPNIQIE